MAVNMEEQPQNTKSTNVTLNDVTSGPGDNPTQPLPGIGWRDRTAGQIRAEDDGDGEVNPSTEGPGKPPL